MLFRAEITKETLKDENLLVEQLYIFLNHYVSKRLVYESQTEWQDCVQDTIMYILDRYHKLTIEDLEAINIEQFFYNRARQYVSLYLRGLTRRRDTVKRFAEYEKIKGQVASIGYALSIDAVLLDRILKDYYFDEHKQYIIKCMVINKLVQLGYKDDQILLSQETIDAYDPTGILYTISYAITDEYLLASVKEGVGDNK